MFGLKTNRNWNLLRKFWNLHIKISMENWLFTHFLSLLPGPLSFYTALENNTIFLHQFFRGGSEGHQGRACKGLAAWAVTGGGAPRTLEKFSKNVYKINEKLQFFKNFQENFAIFSKNFWKFYRIFGENVDKNLQKLEICICRGFWGRSPPTLANLWKYE